MTNSINEISGADYILIIGSNTTETHPIIGLQVKKALRQGAKLTVIDPRSTELAQLANCHLSLKPGTDGALLNGLAHVIIKEDLWNQSFVTERTEGFANYQQSLEKYTPEFTEQITGIPTDIIRQVARGYAQANQASILYTMGITQHTSGTANVLAVANLALLCGHIGKKHTGVNPLRGQNNVQGACDMGALPDVLPGYQKVTSDTVRNKFTATWQIDSLPAKPGLTVGEIIDAAHQGLIKGMYIMGENPVLSDANANHVKAALENLDFLVVQDIFLSETAQLADVVLPAVSYAEKDGTFTNTERRVQLVRKAIEPLGDAKPDWQIICLLANAMGYPMKYSSPAAIMAEAAILTPSYGGIEHHRLENGGLQWPCPDPTHPGTAILHQGTFSRGLGKFNTVEYLPAAETPDSEYPLLLSTGRRLYHYHTGTMTLRTALQEHFAADYLEINPLDANKLGIKCGDWVKVSSRRGKIQLSVKITEIVPPGTVFTSFHFPAAPVNQLTNSASDTVSKIPELKVCAVKVESVIG
jgi:formate dehydrogenase alpha subunit